MRHGQNCKFQHFWNTPLSKVGKSCQKLVKKWSKSCQKSCQKVVKKLLQILSHLVKTKKK
jgi:hypothetical protein